MLIATRGGGLKNRAFTLIELLAVIIIIGVIALIATPVIIGVINKTEKQAFERSIDGLLETVRLDYSTDSFVSPREYYYEGKDLILLTVAEETKDESVGMKGKIEGKGFIYIDEEGIIHIENICSKKYCANGEENKIEIVENESGVIPEVGKNDPIIRLIGEKTLYVNLNEIYEEPGAVAKTKSGKELEYTKEITAMGEIVSEIDSSVENTYVITYKTTNEEKEASVTRTVIVLDMKPEIGIPEGSVDYVLPKDIFIWASAKRPNAITSFIVEIKKDGEIISTDTIKEDNNKTIRLLETGVYEVTVTVTDNNNHTSTMTRIYKIDSKPPEITFKEEIELKANEVSGFDFKEDETVIVTDNIELDDWEVRGELDSLKEESTITYIARDQAGNETSVERTIKIKPAKEPDINSSSPGSNGIWVGPQDITLYAMILIENDELTSFSYHVDDGEEINVPIKNNNQQAETKVILNETGKHTITIKAIGKHKNEKEKTIGEFWIDATEPEVGVISGNTDTWTANKTLTARLTDNDSKIMYYALIRDNATKPEETSSEWESIGENPTSPYNFSKTVFENGTYYLWAKDAAGNISATSQSVTVSTIDVKEPVLTASNYSGKYGTDHVLATAKFGEMGGSTVCKNGTEAVTNVKDIKQAGTYSIKCTATGNNGKKLEKTITLTLQNRTFTEIMSGTGRFNETAKSFEEVMKPLLGTSVANNDPDHNLRYVGSNPNNYVWFNGEKWRIIGLFGGQAKIIREESLGTKAWNTDNINNWAVASLKTELNGSYLDRIEEASQNYIDTTYEWKLGGTNNASVIRAQFYEAERGTGKYGENPTTWIGAIGLMYPTDYAYASNGGGICDEAYLYNWYEDTPKKECVDKSWLYTGYVQWTLTPTLGQNQAFMITQNVNTNSKTVNNATYAQVFPTLYLKSNIKIKSGKGTKEEPYQLTESDINTNDPDGNKRYVGASPNNYVKFNNQLWRVIGLFDGQAKIIKAESLGYMAWDENNINNWSTSTLQKELNVGTTSYLSSIDATSKSYIDQNHLWKVGGINNSGYLRKDFYESERGTIVYGDHAKTWTGAIGLMYPTDYAYASSGGSICNQTTLYNWYEEEPVKECAEKSWLYYNFSNIQWTITPHSSLPTYAWMAKENINTNSHQVNAATFAKVSPTLYLKKTVTIKGGTGTESDPYLLS